MVLKCIKCQREYPNNPVTKFCPICGAQLIDVWNIPAIEPDEEDKKNYSYLDR